MGAGVFLVVFFKKSLSGWVFVVLGRSIVVRQGVFFVSSWRVHVRINIFF